jgi:hypothetical protein
VTVRSTTDPLRLETSDGRRSTVATDLLAARRERAPLCGGDLDAGRRADGNCAAQPRLTLWSSP